MTEVLWQFGPVLVLLVVGGLSGRIVETAHFRRLAHAEAKLSGVVVANIRQLPANWHAGQPMVVAGTAVIATDYYKVFAASLRKLVGGKLRGYETLVERARRQALVRMRQQAQAAGANVVWNVRIETSAISTSRRTGGVEVIAYGTAMRVV